MLFLNDDEIVDGSLQDMCYHVGCGYCKYCDPCANMEGQESRCKRLDHKHIQFAVPWFKSYDCGQLSAIMCADFKPVKWSKYLYEHWTSPIDYAANGDESRIRGYVGLCLDGDQSVRYYVTMKDFWFNTFTNPDGSLKWVKKMYYKQSRSSPTGYKLITEWRADARERSCMEDCQV